MSSRSGPRAVGTDGNDYRHRQRIASNIKLSVQYKFYLKLLFGLHFLVLLAMWTKVGGEFFFNELHVKAPSLWWRLDLPSAYPWEYVWCLSFVPILFALFAFPKNRVKPLTYHYYGQFLFGILPCCLGLGSQFPELIDYVFNAESSRTPTFSGHFPMVVLWYIFFLIAFQIHLFAMYFSYYLDTFWRREPPTVVALTTTEHTKSD